MNQCIEVRAENDSIQRLMEFGDAVEQNLPLSFDQSYLMRLAIEEIATNIIKYGYARGEPGVIQVCCGCEGGVLRVAIRDQGQPFDPHDSPEPDWSDDVAARKVGGLGVFLVRELADDVQYHHDAVSGWNELVVLKGTMQNEE